MSRARPRPKHMEAFMPSHLPNPPQGGRKSQDGALGCLRRMPARTIQSAASYEPLFGETRTELHPNP